MVCWALESENCMSRLGCTTESLSLDKASKGSRKREPALLLLPMLCAKGDNVWQTCHNTLDNSKQEGWVQPEPGRGSCLSHAAHRNHTLEKSSAQQGTGTSLPFLNGPAVSQGTEFRDNKHASRAVGRFGNLFLQGMFSATLTLWDTSTAQKLGHSYQQTTGATQDHACNSYWRCLFSPKMKSTGITKENRTKERSLLAISLWDNIRPFPFQALWAIICLWLKDKKEVKNEGERDEKKKNQKYFLSFLWTSRSQSGQNIFLYVLRL